MKSQVSHKSITAVISLGILGLVVWIYWPAHQAGFVWVDKIIFHNAAWLRTGDGWKRLVFHSFYEWINYFRPLVVALFVIEVRAFDVAPGPMHVVSLGIHLANTLLVGLLALNLRGERPGANKSSLRLVGMAMLLYGLHPALIEPVVWISSQFELVVTFFMLLGILLNATIRHPVSRAFAVATCFFLAACAKESAVSFPLLLLVFDWMRRESQRPIQEPLAALQSLWRRQWPVYLCVLVAGFAYLALRYWALGFLVQPNGSQPGFSLARLQTVSFLYLTYWRIVVWPMAGMGPIHPIDLHQFATFGTTTGPIDLVAFAIFLYGLYFAWKRRPFGCLILAVTVALIPVLHIVPVEFDTSLYHERYAMIGVAMTCAILPFVVSSISWPNSKPRSVVIGASTVVIAWLGLAMVNIRVTLPLWSDEAKLWLWVLQEHPESLDAKDHLLSVYLELNDHVHARRMADLLMVEKRPCPTCMVNIANLAISDGDLPRATVALERAKQMIARQAPQSLVLGYIITTGQLREMKHDSRGAEEAYRDAITMGPLDPKAQMSLALLLARQGRMLEARKQAELALSLFAPDERDEEHRQFEYVLMSPASGLTTPKVQPEHEN